MLNTLFLMVKVTLTTFIKPLRRLLIARLIFISRKSLKTPLKLYMFFLSVNTLKSC